MVPARNLLRRHYDSYGGGCFDDSHYSKPSLRSNQMMMAEHHTSTTGGGQETQEEESEQEQEVKPPADDSWLQLGIGVSPSSSAAAASSSAPAPPGPSVELQLFSDKPSSLSSSLPTVSGHTLPMFSSAPPQLGYSRPPTWGFWNSNLMNMGGASSSSSTSPMLQQPPLMMMMPQLYNVQRFSLPPPPAPAVEGGPHFGELRVVSPPARQQATGVWFLLKAAENQVREPFLPQIPKSYIRIKDGRMTVRLLMKYLVRKLGLDDESEVQILCRGQLLPPFLTLLHVRDHIWCLSEAVTAFIPDSASGGLVDHVMTLQYGRGP